MKNNAKLENVVAVERGASVRCLIYNRWEPYLAKFSKQLVPRLGARAVM